MNRIPNGDYIKQDCLFGEGGGKGMRLRPITQRGQGIRQVCRIPLFLRLCSSRDLIARGWSRPLQVWANRGLVVPGPKMRDKFPSHETASRDSAGQGFTLCNKFAMNDVEEAGMRLHPKEE